MQRIVPDGSRRGPRPGQRPAWIWVLLLVALVWANWPRIEEMLNPPEPSIPLDDFLSGLPDEPAYPSPGDMEGCEKFRVTGVHDGLHIWLTNSRGEEFKAELLGVRYQQLSGPDWNAEAAWMLTSLLKEEQVWLWTVEGEENQYSEDDELLVWVWRIPDLLFINHELIRQGLALYEEDSDQFDTALKAAEDAAMESERGFWNPDR